MTWKSQFQAKLLVNYRVILVHIVLPSATRIESVTGGERGNIQTGREVKVITISLLGCSTSVALATGPTDEEEDP